MSVDQSMAEFMFRLEKNINTAVNNTF